MIVVWLASALAQTTATGLDQPSLDLQRWSMPLDSQGTLWTVDAEDVPWGWKSAGLAVGYQYAPVIYRLDDGTTTAVVEHATTTSVLGAWGFGRLRAGVEVPLLFGVSGLDLQSPAALGDLSLDAKLVALDHEAPVGLALLGRLRLPTTAGASADWASGTVGYSLAVAADVEAGPVLIAANLGTLGRPTSDFDGVVLDDALLARLGAAWRVRDPVTISLDLASDLNYSGVGLAGRPVEALLGGSLRVRSWDTRLGVGRGLSRGIGAPGVRVVAAVGWAPDRTWDRDADGIVDTVDGCRDEPEDADQFEDADGCPDPDNDQDRLLDAADACPIEPEDHDQHQDADGCPDPFTTVTFRGVDSFGRPVRAELEVMVGGAPQHGSQELVAELMPGEYQVQARSPGFIPITLPISVDPGPPQLVEVAMVAEPTGTLVVRVMDPKGQPIRDASWRWPGKELPAMIDGTGTARIVSGVHTLLAEAPGFGSASFPVSVTTDTTATVNVTLRKSRLEVTREKIVILEKVYFDTNRATIQARSFPLLDEIAATVLARPDLLLLRVEGHTDTRGSNSDNLTLSDQRARAVRDYLVGRGVDPSRLVALGYGETRPLDDREVASAWEKNRRVEFFVEKWAP